MTPNAKKDSPNKARIGIKCFTYKFQVNQQGFKKTKIGAASKFLLRMLHQPNI
jgi:hypothetical protein